MPLCTLHLLALHQTTPNPLSTCLSTLQSSNISPLVVSRVVRWIILPTSISTEHLLSQNISWDLLVILPNTNPLPSSVQTLVQHQWTVTAGVPSRLIQDFASKNKAFLHPEPGTIPKLSSALDRPKIADSAQDLEMSKELASWIQSFYSNSGNEGQGAVSMLNLLSFKPDKKESYLKYGQAFSSNVGSKRGGNAKIVGTIVDVNGQKKEEGDGGWDEIALAHYPSILHFADMLGSEDYQEVNKKYRVPALKDTFILFTSEVGIEEIIGKGDRVREKL